VFCSTSSAAGQQRVSSTVDVDQRGIGVEAGQCSYVVPFSKWCDARCGNWRNNHSSHVNAQYNNGMGLLVRVSESQEGNLNFNYSFVCTAGRIEKEAKLGRWKYFFCNRSETRYSNVNGFIFSIFSVRV